MERTGNDKVNNAQITFVIKGVGNSPLSWRGRCGETQLTLTERALKVYEEESFNNLRRSPEDALELESYEEGLEGCAPIATFRLKP